MREGWTRVRLGEAVEQVKRSVVVSDVDKVPYAGVRLDLGGVYCREPVSSDLVQAKTLWRVQTGDVVYNRMWATRGAFGVAGSAVDGCLVSNDFPTFVVRPEMSSPAYIELALHSSEFLAAAETTATGSTGRRRLKEREFLDLAIDLPPLAVQQRIVDLVGSLDDAIRTAEAVRAGYDGVWWEIATSLAARCQSVSFVPLSSISEIRGGLTKNKTLESGSELVEVPYLRVANVHRRRLDLSEVMMVSVTPDKLEQLRLLPGDLLLNEGGDKDKLGRGDVWRGQVENCIHQNHVFRARITDENYSPEFVSHWANSFGKTWFEIHGTQTTGIASISKSTLSRFPVPEIPFDEQVCWSGALSSAFTAMCEAESAIEHLRSSRSGLLTVLLSGDHEIPETYGSKGQGAAA